MQQPDQSTNFWLGNVVLGAAFVVLLALGTLWEWLGVWALGLWIALVAVGVYLLTRGKGGSPLFPD